MPVQQMTYFTTVACSTACGTVVDVHDARLSWLLAIYRLTKRPTTLQRPSLRRNYAISHIVPWLFLLVASGAAVQ